MSLLKITALQITILTTVAIMSIGCASDGGQSVAEATPGSFVTYICDKDKSFSARFDTESNSVRIRSLTGSADLHQDARGLYRDTESQWILTLGAGNRTELVSKGKAEHTNCSAKS